MLKIAETVVAWLGYFPETRAVIATIVPTNPISTMNQLKSNATQDNLNWFSNPKGMSPAHSKVAGTKTPKSWYSRCQDA